MQRTRREILHFLKRRGQATLEQLASALGVVPVTVRSHLSILERDNLVCYHEVRGKVGRPYYVYSLTPAAEDLFPKCYDSLTNLLVNTLARMSGDDSGVAIATHLADCWSNEHAQRVAGKTLAERIDEVARIRSEEGAWAEVEQVEGAVILRQYNCPCPCTAQRHPEVICEAELQYLRTLLDTDLERVSWQIKGDRTCAYRISLQHRSQATDTVTPRGDRAF